MGLNLETNDVVLDFDLWLHVVRLHFLVFLRGPGAGQRPEVFPHVSTTVLHPNLMADVLFGDGLVDFVLHFLYDGIQVVFVLHLQLLVMAAALVRSPFLQNLAQTKEHLSCPSCLLGLEIRDVGSHEMEVNSIFT